MNEEKVLTNAVLCFPIKENQILLATKIAKIGAGCWNGYGGGIEHNESPTQAMVRELEEEAGVTAIPEDLVKVGIIYFHNTKTNGATFVCMVHVYFLSKWQGEFCTTKEMANPSWFKKNSLPLEQMMPADKVWLPIVLSGEKIIGKASYGPYQKKLLDEVQINYVKNFLD